MTGPASPTIAEVLDAFLSDEQRRLKPRTHQPLAARGMGVLLAIAAVAATCSVLASNDPSITD